MAETSHRRDDSATAAELRRRLEEAEETLRAIREGEVDALVVRRTRDEEVFTLQGGNDSYRAFMETMVHAAAALGSRGEVLYANSALCGLLGKPLATVENTVLADQFDSAGARISGLLESARTGKQAVEVSLGQPGQPHHFLMAAAPLDIGLVSGWALTFTDITERVLYEKSIASERAARAIIASANEAVVVCDEQGRITHVNAAVLTIESGDLLGRPFHEAIPLTFHDSTGLVQAEDLVAMANAGNAVKGIEAHAPHAPRVKDLLISAAPLSLTDGSSSGCVITMVDLTLRKAAEKQQLLLMAELDHRVKNTLTLVLSILSRSTEGTLDSFKESFAGRIHALAATHNLLSDKSWTDLSLADIVTAELAPFVQATDGRLRLEDLEIAVTPRAAIALGLVFHELATNAAKYGALSNEDGVVLVRSRPDQGKSLAVIEWIETGGPPVTPPPRRGFGHTVIARSLQYSPHGGAELTFDPAGVRCVIRVPDDERVGDAGPG